MTVVRYCHVQQWNLGCPSAFHTPLMQLRAAFFWVITQRIVVIPYRRFGTTYRSHLQFDTYILTCICTQHTHISYFPHTGCPRRNGQNFGRVFLTLNYTDITQNTYIQSWTVTEIMAIEKCGLLGCPRTVSRPWRHTRTLRMPGNDKPLANIGMQWPWRHNAHLRPA